MNPHRPAAAGLLCGLFFVSVGLLSCAQADGERELFPTTGELFVAGEPAQGALLAFHPQQGDSPDQWPQGYPHAVVDGAGKFVVSTYRAGDGCPAGKYVVLITWPAAAPGESDDEDAPTVDRLEGRYATRDASLLTVTVEARPTTLRRFDLK